MAAAAVREAENEIKNSIHGFKGFWQINPKSKITADTDTTLPKGCASYRVYPVERQGLV